MTQNKKINLLLEVLGCFISAAGIYSFAVAAEVPVTGVAGISAILYRLFGLPMGLSNVLINVPIIFFSYKLLGRSFLLRSLRCMILFAVFTDYLLPFMPVYTGNRLLATICGSVVSGIGDALIYMQNSSTGGIDFVTMAIKAKHPHLPFGNLTFGAALAVILLNGAVFHDVDSIIYGLMFNFIVAAVINKMMFGFSSSMLALIVTDNGKAACDEIDRVADRGSTILQGRGGYGGQPKDVVLCACSNKQLYEIEHAMQVLDPGCFIIMLQSNEVQGEGFRRLELGKNEEKS
ncbi:YitT family protein [uncultured Subdoligranulum sp.]|uniref:YitT family protein n=1 Tax=uncultured Subdoligranulum sp. TaxID=512298 RepID=UPI0025D8BBBB|nr:YitT family protein [uncultured Subdoligranulum sp.]